MSWSLCLLLLVAGAAAFECDSDTILRLATNRRQKDIEQECQRASKNEPCKDQDKVDKLWKAYEDVQKEYRKLVDDCVRERTSQRVRRHDPKDPDIDHTGHNHRMRRHGDHDPKDPDIDHTGHNHRRRRHEEHDPNDPNVDHSGHQHRRKRCEEHDHKESNGERTEHEMKREQDHDPDDTNVDHSGHQHRRRRHDDHDPNDPNVDHTGHNHRRKREQEHDTNVDHSGYNHKRRRHVLRDLEPYSEPEREQIRNRRAICKSRSAENLNNFQNEFKNYCHRENICLPDEDLPAGEKRDKIKRLQEERAKKYHEYLLEGAYCNA